MMLRIVYTVERIMNSEEYVDKLMLKIRHYKIKNVAWHNEI